MACIIGAELLAIAFFSYWPVHQEEGNDSKNITYSEEVTLLEDAIITRQESNPPPPPRPQTPIPVPNEEVIEDPVITFEDADISDFTDTLSVTKLEGASDGDEVVSSPQNPPAVIRIVEASTPQEAQNANIKAEITVTFLVDENGRVDEVSISQIKIFEGNSGSEKIVESIGYGLTEATLKAAEQWRFRPARNNGEPVKAYSRQIFTFGF